MKNIVRSIVIAVMSLGLSSAAFADALLVKTVGSGFAPEWLAQSTFCEIHADKVVMKRHVGGILTVETRPLAIDAASLTKLQQKITAAESGTYDEQDVAIVDAPITNVYGGTTLLMRSIMDNPVKWNTSEAAQTLLAIVRQHCDK